MHKARRGKDGLGGLASRSTAEGEGGGGAVYYEECQSFSRAAANHRKAQYGGNRRPSPLIPVVGCIFRVEGDVPRNPQAPIGSNAIFWGIIPVAFFFLWHIFTHAATCAPLHSTRRDKVSVFSESQILEVSNFKSCGNDIWKPFE